MINEEEAIGRNYLAETFLDTIDKLGTFLKDEEAREE